MVNKGAVPIDPLTSVGQFRLGIGDIEYGELNPPEAGYGDFANFSDVEIETLLIQGGGSVVRAIGFGYMKWYAFLSAKAVSVATDDLKVDLTKRANNYLELARIYFGQADQADIVAGNDYFDIAPIIQEDYVREITRPEASPFACNQWGTIL